MYGHDFKADMDKPGKVADPAHGQLKKKNGRFLFAPELVITRDGFGRPVPSRVSLLFLRTQAEPSRYSRGSSRFPRRRPLIYTTEHHRVSPEFIGSRNFVPLAFTTESIVPLCFSTHTKEQSISRRILPILLTKQVPRSIIVTLGDVFPLAMLDVLF